MDTRVLIKMAEADYRRRYDAQEISWNTLYNVLSGLRSFGNYCKKSGKEEEEADWELLRKYRQWCLMRGNRPSTASQKLIPLVKTLRQVQPSAGADDLFYSNKPRRYGGEHSQADTPVRHLSDGQLHSLMSLYQQLPTGREKDCLDLFFFSFHACGLRVSDIITLEWRHLDLQRRILSKVMVKTKTLLTIPLSDAALEILGRWKGRNRRFVFNLLIESFDLSADAALCRAIDSRNRSIRGVLNRIGKQIGLPFPLGMHVARHSFAVKALNSGGVSVHLISRLLGHASVVVTEKVYAVFLIPTLSREVREHLSFTF